MIQCSELLQAYTLAQKLLWTKNVRDFILEGTQHLVLQFDYQSKLLIQPRHRMQDLGRVHLLANSFDAKYMTVQT